MSTLVTASIFLLVLWPAYAALLKYSDRYALNRFLLVAAMVAVCALPFVSLESPAPAISQSLQGTVTYVEQATYGEPTPAKAAEVAPLSVDPVENRVPSAPAVRKVPTTSLVYFGGVGLMLLLLGGRLLFLLALHLRSRLNNGAGYRLLHEGASSGQAFTFGTAVYFSQDVPDDPDFDHILTHERVHARQLHTVDIMLTEVFLCLFWFHPVAWWLRTKMRSNLEYLVDKAVVNQGADRRNYQLALVRQSVAAQGLALALPFSEPSLKSRIARMTGLPEYRVIGIMAAVALTFWLGVAMVVVNGSSGANAGAKEYLAAVAGPGDPYYAYYQEVLSEPITSLEVYTNRMVTGDEYLQLRAILAKVPGAKLYAFKQQFDRGYSLELRIGHNEPATLTHLLPEGTQKWMYMLGVEQGSVGNNVPVAMNLEIEHLRPNGEQSGMIRYLTATQTNSDLNFFELTPDEVKDELLVLVNRKPISLKTNREVWNEKKTARSDMAVINGVNVLDVAADEWPKVVMEGRAVPDPSTRMRKLVNLKAKDLPEEISYRVARGGNGTFRAWYEENIDDTFRSRTMRYNDRYAKLDFLLDTDFGENAMLQVGYRYDRPGSNIVVQVIDDYPNIDAFLDLE